MDHSTPQHRVEHPAEHHTPNVEAQASRSIILPFYPTPYDFDIYPSDLPFNTYPAFNTEISQDFTTALPFYPPNYCQEYNPTVHSPYYTQYYDNYIFEEPLNSPQYPSRQIKHQAAALSTPPLTPHHIGQQNQCHTNSHTQIQTHTQLHSPPVVTQAAATSMALEPMTADINRVSKDANNPVWNGRFDKEYGDIAIAATPLYVCSLLSCCILNTLWLSVSRVAPLFSLRIPRDENKEWRL